MEQRAAGALNGVAIADALGSATTFMSHKRIVKLFGKVVDFIDPKLSTVHESLARGSFTDDTELTIVLANSILECGRVSSECFARALVSWAREKNILETTIIGPSTRRAILKLMSGERIDKAGSGGTTNGCAMRISPVAIFDVGSSIEDTKRDVEEACLPTHCTFIAIAGASAVCVATKRAIEGERSVMRIVDSAVDASMNPECSRCGGHRQRLHLRIEHALRIAEAADCDENLLTSLYSFMKGKRKALTEDAVPVAMAIFYYARGDFNRSALLSANLGGDCDTIGAIAGAMSGAYSGICRIRKEWIKTVRLVSSVDLTRLAGALLHAKGN
ncbi:MAG: ADP-ribosylglycohydrolase family protein [Candidatus Thermoplasmatota archaeon]|nr:ADP-ribosylglycohydrolase family protein [Candidatus Thermoplasmatota archaeon]MCL5437304.1 ADP-ribosylglycohydrolase family protein [Candidatus Thermoplasmatota archaeon]